MRSRKLNSSFRDHSGYVFHDQKGTLLRYVSKSYQADFDLIHSSGLYDKLVQEGLLVAHKDHTAKAGRGDADRYKVIKPDVIPFISYPYEWSFSQLKDAALATLRIQRIAFAHGMTLKDASAYNIQFYKGKPVFIDTLSFEKYQPGKPWVAYKQFCQHFLAPLVLASYIDVRLMGLLREYIDGIPLDLTASLLPLKTKLKPQLAIHIHLHAKSQKRYAHETKKQKNIKISERSLKSLVESLSALTGSLKWKPAGTEWGEYYTFTNYNSRSSNQKKAIIEGFISKTKPKSVWDLGSNDGRYSRIASSSGINTVAFDIDPIAVEKNYQQVVAQKETNILPLVMDLTNPSPAIGWAHAERDSLVGRGSADMVFALALIHHLAISNNVPLSDLAKFFAQVGKHLVIEFVPKGDSQVDKLLATREDIFDNYNEAGFELAFKQYFKTVSKERIKGSKRTLYLLKKT
jgi:hypothetical protein